MAVHSLNPRADYVAVLEGRVRLSRASSGPSRLRWLAGVDVRGGRVFHAHASNPGLAIRRAVEKAF